MLKIKEDSVFKWENYDIFTEHNINIYDAVLGKKLKVKTIDSETEIQIPKGV